jgi:hypothetical protein
MELGRSCPNERTLRRENVSASVGFLVNKRFFVLKRALIGGQECPRSIAPLF